MVNKPNRIHPTETGTATAAVCHRIIVPEPRVGRALQSRQDRVFNNLTEVEHALAWKDHTKQNVSSNDGERSSGGHFSETGHYVQQKKDKMTHIQFIRTR